MVRLTGACLKGAVMEKLECKRDKAFQIAEDIFYVGMQNPGMRTFDIVMRTEYGTTYNSYLIMDEKNVLIETVHHRYTQEFIDVLECYLPIEKLDYVILNHTEPDHSGSLAALLDMNPNITVIGTNAAIKNLGNIMNRAFNGRTVKTDDVLEIGESRNLTFYFAPNLHWPDSMFTYDDKTKILFTCDFLGTHYCEPFLFDDELKNPNFYEVERKNYFDCIFSPFPKFVKDGLARVKQLEPKMVCCSHGPILRGGIKQVVAEYELWVEPVKAEIDVPIFYVSAYGYTKQIASRIEELLLRENIRAKAYDLLETSMEDATQKLLESKMVFFGSPTINADALEPVWELINKSVVPIVKGKPAMVFGSFGWSGEACGFLKDRLEALKYKVYPEFAKIQFNPSEQDLEMVNERVLEFLEWAALCDFAKR